MNKISQHKYLRVAVLKSRADRCGGLEKASRSLARAFVERGCAVQILTSDVRDPSRLEGLPYVELCGRERLTLTGMRRFDNLCKQWLVDHPCDIVFGLDRNRSQTHYRAGNGCHAAYLEQRRMTDSWLKQFSFRLNPLHREILSCERAAFQSRQLRRLFTNSDMVRQEIHRCYGTPMERMSVVHNGVEWLEMEKAFSCWEEYKLPNDPSYHFLFVGQGYRRKGLGFLLKGLAHLRDNDWTLTVVGKDKEEGSFRKLAKRLGIDGQIRFLGQQERASVWSLYQKSDCLVIPSTYDPFANVTIEALAMGLWVVSSEYNGGKEVLTPESGDVIPSLTDPDSVAKSLQQALSQRKTAASALQRRNSVQHLEQSAQLARIVYAAVDDL
ncbi:MAG: glycosyltransferase family 4 protein [Chlamydiia bacterium]|nr:glycosyltransferase family 4 protein [Chlamydiia bacterium]